MLKPVAFFQGAMNNELSFWALAEGLPQLYLKFGIGLLEMEKLRVWTWKKNSDLKSGLERRQVYRNKVESRMLEFYKRMF